MPPANPTVEPELDALVGTDLATYTARFPVFGGWDLQHRNRAYLDAVPESVTAFGSLRLDATLVACTGCHYLLEPAQDRDLYARLSAEAGVPIVSATLAITHVLRAIRSDEVVLVSPYEPWLTELSERYWSRAGFTVSRVVQIAAAHPYEVEPAALTAEVESAALDPDATILFTGTGAPTVDTMLALRATRSSAIVSSNLCGAWWAHAVLDGGRQGREAHPLVADLDRRIAAAAG